MENIKHRAVIEFLTKEDQRPKDIYERMVRVYGDTAPSYATVKKWSAEFRRGRQSLEDDPRSGRPVEVTTDEMCSTVEAYVMENRRVKVAEVAHFLGVSTGTVETILHTKLGLSKVSSRWVPRMLTPEMKRTRVDACRELLDWYTTNPDNFFSRIVTGDETWLHHWDPETKQESMQWKHKTSPAPKKFRTQASAGKVMATIFWDTDGVILIDYLPPKTTITGLYYATLVKKLRSAIKEKRRGKLGKGILLLHDNAPAHASQLAQQALRECSFMQLPHPPYSPDLAPSDFYLFRHLKKFLRGKQFRDNEELKGATEAWLGGQDKEFYKTGLVSVVDKWNKCIEVKGDYIEK